MIEAGSFELLLPRMLVANLHRQDRVFVLLKMRLVQTCRFEARHPADHRAEVGLALRIQLRFLVLLLEDVVLHNHLVLEVLHLLMVEADRALREVLPAQRAHLFKRSQLKAALVLRPLRVHIAGRRSSRAVIRAI